MTSEPVTLPDNPSDAAAYWFARVHSGHFSQSEQAQFMQWRQADSRHEHEYRALETIWETSLLLPDAELQAMLDMDKVPLKVLAPTRRRFLGRAAGLTAVAGLGAVGVYIAQQDTVSHALHYATAFGERHTVTLPDGSTVFMNVATELELHFQAGRRHMRLLQGEATFSVQADPNRVFVVEAGQVQVQVTGTVFNVRRGLADDVDVAVSQGTVSVSSGPWWHKRKAALSAGMLAQWQAGKNWQVQVTDVAARTAWRQGKVVFRDQPLDQVIQEMNRYLPEPIVLMDAHLGRLRMAGVFNIDDAPGFLLALQAQLPVRVIPRADGRVGLVLVP